MSKCIVCGQIFSVYKEPDLKHCSEKCQMTSDRTWRFWIDTITKHKFEIDFDTSEGMSLANDISKNLIRITEEEFRK